MGTPGRKPKPTALKKLAGNPGKRPLDRAEVRPRAGVPAMPRRRLSAEGQRLWRRLAPELAELGLMTEVDGPAFEMLCVHYSVAVQAARQLREEGLTVMGTTGERKHPCAQILREASTAFRMYAEQFGLTPAARARLRVDPGEDEPSLQEYLAELLGAGVSAE